MGVFHPSAIGQGQQCCHRQHQPVAGDARRVGAPGLVPLPAQAFDDLEAQIEAGREVMRACIDAWGTLTGEHGIGAEKQMYMHWTFSEQDMAATKRLRAAFCPRCGFQPRQRSFLTRLSRIGVGIT